MGRSPDVLAVVLEAPLYGGHHLEAGAVLLGVGPLRPFWRRTTCRFLRCSVPRAGGLHLDPPPLRRESVWIEDVPFPRASHCRSAVVSGLRLRLEDRGRNRRVSGSPRKATPLQDGPSSIRWLSRPGALGVDCSAEQWAGRQEEPLAHSTRPSTLGIGRKEQTAEQKEEVLGPHVCAQRRRRADSGRRAVPRRQGHRQK